MTNLKSEFQKITNELHYCVTNESLDAVVTGLDLHPEDTVLAIGGSGDQAFAILEYVKKVIVIDINQIQLEFIKLRKEALKQGKDDLFFTSKYLVIEGNESLEARKKYFSQERLEKIQSKLENLVLLPPANIFRLNLDEKVSKIYASNVTSSRWGVHDVSHILGVVKNLSLGGLIYFTQTHLDLEKQDIPGLKEEYALAQKARQYEEEMEGFTWQPIVYRKVEEVEK